ncbi:hypothetical protein L3Q82_008232 [Scortum barcoo]|uniref:Uncharacterized protein n=1 Tax=Scortum barcoo TaxID=214431 RepID=A0ACB8WIT0_9TELE|nr:hypothetical protein L3Q82_008232 [Scortum barcoo]
MYWSGLQPSVKRGWDENQHLQIRGHGSRSRPEKGGMPSPGGWRGPASSGGVQVSRPGVLFTSEGKIEREIDRRIGAASAVMRSVYRTVVVKKELSRKAKLSIYRSIYAPTLTYGHELWVMTEKDKIADTSGRNEFPPQGGWALP